MVALATLLSSCGAAVLPVMSGLGAGTGAIALLKSVDTDADELLKLDKPVKQAVCDAHKEKAPKFEAWCSHLPDDVEGLAVQWAAVIAAP